MISPSILWALTKLPAVFSTLHMYEVLYLPQWHWWRFYTHISREETEAEWLFKLPNIILLNHRARIHTHEVWYLNLFIITPGLECPDILFLQPSEIIVSCILILSPVLKCKLKIQPCGSENWHLIPRTLPDFGCSAGPRVASGRKWALGHKLVHLSHAAKIN